MSSGNLVSNTWYHTGDLVGNITVTGSSVFGAPVVGDLLHAHLHFTDPNGGVTLWGPVVTWYDQSGGYWGQGPDLSVTASMAGRDLYVIMSDTQMDSSSYHADVYGGSVGHVALASNTAPDAVDDAVTAREDSTNPSGILTTNDTDAEGDSLTVVAVDGGAVSVSHTGAFGKLHVTAYGWYDYFLDNSNAAIQALGVGETTTDTFTYEVSDGHGGTDLANVVITINGANDAPVVVGEIGTMVTQSGYFFDRGGNLLSNDSDPDGDVLMVVQAGRTALGPSRTNSAVWTPYGGAQIWATGRYYYNQTDYYSPGSIAALAAGETVTDTITYVVGDGHGGRTQGTIVETITGVNDAPTAVADTGSATEGGYSDSVHATGNVLANDSDVDHNDTKTVTALTGGTLGALKIGTYGAITLNADGSYDYFVWDNYTSVDSLRLATDTLTESFTYTMRDAAGETSTATLTITIHGANDFPVGIDDTAEATETGTGAGSAASGNVLVNDVDPDTGDSHVVQYVYPPGGVAHAPGAPIAGWHGSLTLNGDGSYSYAVNDADAAVNALAAGETLVDHFSYWMHDAGGLGGGAGIDITIQGANDAPTAVNDTASATESGTAAGIDPTGNVLANDSDDNGDTDFVTAGVTTGTYGTLTLNADGTYTYAVDNGNADVNAMNASETLTDSFTYTVTDGAGASSTATLAVTVHGANDAPSTPYPELWVSTTEDWGGGPMPVALWATDPDHGDTLVAIDAMFDTGSGPAADIAPGIAFDGTTYSMWSSDPRLDHYAPGETYHMTMSFLLSDGHGGTVARSLNVSILGADDAPRPSGDFGSATEAGVAAGNAATGDVLANDTDPDDGDSITVSGVAGGAVDTPVAGLYGTLTIAADGTYTYAVDDGNASVNAMNASGTLTDTFTYSVVDSYGKGASASLAITIHGANDAPTAVADQGSAAENGYAPGSAATGNVLANDTDVDTTDTKTVSAISGGTVGSMKVGTYGGITLNADGSYEYVIWDNLTAVDSLRFSTDTLTESFSYTMRDAAGATSSSTLTITIHGTNDAPSAQDDTGSATETGTSAGSGAAGNVLLNDTDIDNGDSMSVQWVYAGAGGAHNPGAALAGAYGSLTLNADGSYAYAVNDGNATVNALAAGETLVDHFSYWLHDAAGAGDNALLDITIHGANDAPLGSADTNTATEAGISAGHSAVGNLLDNDTDVDNGHVLSVGDVNVTSATADVAGSFGTLHVTALGSYSYSVSNSNTAVDGLALGESLSESFSYVVEDEYGATSLSHITIVVQGANDGPQAFDDVLHAVEAGTAAGTSPTGNLLANDTDVDVNDTHVMVAVGSSSFASSVTSVEVAGRYGVLDVTVDGAYTYVVDNADATVAALTASGSVTESFSYTMADNHGAWSVGHITVQIQGANDAPVAVDDLAEAVEAGASNGGYYWFDNVLANDTDVDANHSLTVVGVDGNAAAVTAWEYGQHGWFYMFSNGDYYYYANNDDVEVDALGPSGTLQDSFSYTVADEHGATSVGHIGVTIHGQNDAPSGTVTIEGVARVGQMLTAAVDLTDPEGVGRYHYQWMADGVAVGNDIGSYMLGASDSGKTITVTVSYVDGGGTLESVTGSLVTQPGLTLKGSGGADHIVGTSGDDWIDGGLGKDRMEGLEGNDTYVVDNTRDVVVELPGQGVDTVIAGVSFSLLVNANIENLTLSGVANLYARGNAGDNAIAGNGGNNAITGYAGADTLTGGNGADTFIYTNKSDSTVAAHDVITDFHATLDGKVLDKIDLRLVDAVDNVAGNQAFRFIGTASFADYASAAGLLRFDPFTHMLQASTNADANPEFEVMLVGIDHIGTDAGGISLANIVL